MQLDEGILTLSEPVADEQIDALKPLVEQAEKIIIQCADLGGSVIQLLLCASAQAEVSVEVESIALKQVFAHPCLTGAER